MSAFITMFLSVIKFLVDNKATIVELVQDLEVLLPNTSGTTKLETVKAFIAKSLSIEKEIDSVWPLVDGLFAALVASIKNTTKPAA